MTNPKQKMLASYKAIFIISIFMVFFVLIAGALTKSKGSGLCIWTWGYTAWLMYKRSYSKFQMLYKKFSKSVAINFSVILLVSTPIFSSATDLRNLTDSVMNGWRADYQTQMISVLKSSSCESSVDLRNLSDSVMNGWRADFQKQMSSLVNCSRCNDSVDMKNLTDSVMNKWRADFQKQMGSLISCINNK